MLSFNRRNFLKSAAAASVGVGLSGCYNDLVQRSEGKRPNIIFLLTDDQRWDTLGCAGNPIIKTPNIDWLAAKGVRFSNAFVTTSICCSSRASFLTGQYTCRHGIVGFANNFSVDQLAHTYPLLLRANGYTTGFVGKYGVGSQMPVDSFDFWRGIEGQPKYYNEMPDGTTRHLTSIIDEDITEFIDMQGAEQPFCLSVSFKSPHVEDSDPLQFLPDSRYDQLYQDVEVPKSATASEEYFERLPEFLKNSEARKRWFKRFDTPEKYQRSVKNYYRLVSGVDAVVGNLLNQLEEKGLADNTVIIYAGDNGFYLGEKGLAGKWFGHEESIRVPIIVYDPRLKGSQKGQVVTEMALNIDVAPTILNLAQIKVPPRMQGQSLLPLINKEPVKWRKDFLYEHLFEHPDIPKSIGVRTREWKYLVYPDFDNFEELYDLDADPQEINNLAAEQEYQIILKSLRRRAEELKDKYCSS